MDALCREECEEHISGFDQLQNREIEWISESVCTCCSYFLWTWHSQAWNQGGCVSFFFSFLSWFSSSVLVNRVFFLYKNWKKLDLHFCLISWWNRFTSVVEGLKVLSMYMHTKLIDFVHCPVMLSCLWSHVNSRCIYVRYTFLFSLDYCY